jgi:hypothetical protein
MVGGFSCNHIVADLYGQILLELTKGLEMENAQMKQTEEVLILRVDENLHRMPRKVKINNGSQFDELLVSWTDPEGWLALKLYGLDLQCQATLHRDSTCSERKEDLLVPQSESSNIDFRYLQLLRA